MALRTITSVADDLELDTVWAIPDWSAECIALMCEEWGKAGRWFEIEGELLDRLTAEAKRRGSAG